MEINTKYSSNRLLSQINSSTKMKSTSEVSFNSYLESVKKNEESDSVKKVDYSNYSVKELRTLPYEEARANYEQIHKRYKELDVDGIRSDEITALGLQLGSASGFIKNEAYNKALYETKQKMDTEKVFDFSFEIAMNMNDYFHGKDVYASFVVSNDEVHSDKMLTQEQMNSINFKDFISKMSSVFTSGHRETTGVVKNQYKGIMDGYLDLQKSYNQNEGQPYYA